MTGLLIGAAVIAVAMLAAFAWRSWRWHREVQLERHLMAALLEQGRREREHHIAYRLDQRVHAVQQRLSRTLGRRRAFDKQLEHRLREALR